MKCFKMVGDISSTLSAGQSFGKPRVLPLNATCFVDIKKLIIYNIITKQKNPLLTMKKDPLQYEKGVKIDSGRWGTMINNKK